MNSPTDRERILVVDDAPDTIEVLRRNLTGQRYRVFTALSVADAITILEAESVDLVITDLKMPRVSGMDLVRYVRENLKDTGVMMITGHATVEGAVEAIKAGAEEYLIKPFTDKELLAAVQGSLATLKMRRVGERNSAVELKELCGLIGESTTMQRVFKDIAKAAPTSATVLITGESGTGKELVARAIHYNSPRATAPFIPVNCGGIPEGLLDVELFGHLKGAFTGATNSRAGFFQAADGGTIFLDEISETSLPMQVKLLRVLQDKAVCMVGARQANKVDVRIMAATNKDLLNLLKKSVFREDLYFRLHVIPIEIPPLRERENDILILAEQFITRFAQEFDSLPLRFSSRAYRALKNYYWPGNVRELENLIQGLTVMAEGEEIDVPDLPVHMRFSAPKGAVPAKTLAHVEAQHIRLILEMAGGNKTRAAEVLGIDRKTLREKMKRHQIQD